MRSAGEGAKVPTTEKVMLNWDSSSSDEGA